ncbi:MAG: TVP38/TMEM64 family protein [Candidatus Brocadiia bacterium]
MSEAQHPATATDSADDQNGAGGWLRFLPVVWPAFILVVLILLGLALPLGRVARALLGWADAAGWWGPLVVTAGYVLSCMLVLPTSLFTFGAGFLYGLPAGMATAVGGSMVGALSGYLLSRLLLARKVLHYAEHVRPLAVIRNAARADGKKVLLLTRVSPITPFALLNYLYGALHVHPWRFAWTTALGMLPGTFLCVYIGTGLRSLSAVTDQGAGNGAASWPYWAGLAGTAMAVLLIGHFARKALLNASGRVEQQGADDSQPDGGGPA